MDTVSFSNKSVAPESLNMNFAIFIEAFLFIEIVLMAGLL